MKGVRAADLMTDEELLHELLGSGARELIGEHGCDLRSLSKMTPREAGESIQARLFLVAVELGRRVMTAPMNRERPFTSSREIQAHFGPKLKWKVDEELWVVLLDTKQRPIKEHMLSFGTPNGVAIGLREVFALAVRHGAASMVLVHNHPSGDPTPSPEDAEFTRRAVEAGEMMELKVLDHVIVAGDSVFSFLDAGLLGSG
jgi:DNA repair protein RadC